MNLFLDIETAPSQAPGALDEILATIRPPASYKKAETIAAWMDSEAAGAADREWRKQSLDGGTQGEIISIAMATDSTCPASPAWVRCRKPGESERELITSAFRVVEGWQKEIAAELTPGAKPWLPATFPVGHNLTFDLGYLWRRARVHRVAVPAWLPSPPQLRHGQSHFCTMHAWAGFSGMVGLDKLCLALNIASPKGDMHGSMVFDAWLAGETDKIATYNMQDVRAVEAIYSVLQGVPA